MLLNLVTKNDSIWIVSCSWSKHTTLLLMFVAEKVLLLLVISLTGKICVSCMLNGHGHLISRMAYVQVTIIERHYYIPVFKWLKGYYGFTSKQPSTIYTVFSKSIGCIVLESGSIGINSERIALKAHFHISLCSLWAYLVPNTIKLNRHLVLTHEKCSLTVTRHYLKCQRIGYWSKYIDRIPRVLLSLEK